MKAMITLVAMILGSLNAIAGSYYEYDISAVSLVNKVQKTCPAEFAQLMQDENLVLSAEEQESQGVAGIYRTTTLTIGVRYPAPSFHEKAVAKLLISGVALNKKQVRAPDAPTLWETDCRIVKVD